MKIFHATFIAALLTTTLAGNPALQESQKVSIQTNKTLQKNQKKIDSLDDKRRLMHAEYDILSKELATYKTYNGQLQDIINSQNDEMLALERQSNEIEVTKREILPLMHRMIDTLERFIQNDRPFLPDERKMRVASLRENMKRADISIAAKYRQILEAYQIEIDYGNTIEAYTGDVGGKQVTFLKVGRIALFYQGRDGHQTGVWDQKHGSWKILEGDEYYFAIAKGIKIARKQRSPELFFVAVDQEEVRK